MSQIVIVATVNIKPEFKQEVLQFIKEELIEKSRKEDGNLQYDLHQDKNDENNFVIVELWASADSIEQHNATEHFQTFVQLVEGKINNLDVKQLEKIA